MVQPWPDQPYQFQACYNVAHTYCITTENFSLALMQAILKCTTRLVEQILWGSLTLAPIILFEWHVHFITGILRVHYLKSGYIT